MLGQRRALGVRVDSQRNVIGLNNQQIGIVKQVVKRKVYGGRQCMISEETAADIDNYLKALEKKRQPAADFLKHAQIDGRMRGILLDWLLQIQAKFQLSAETFYLSCMILDRIIVPLDVNKQNFQLIGLACIFIGSKFEEVLIPNVHDFCYMGGDFCTVENLFEAERKVLRALEFQLTFAYPNHFLRKMRLLMPSDDHSIVYEIGKLLVDVSILDYGMAAWLPSHAAAASVHLAYKIIQKHCPIELLQAVGVSMLKVAEYSKILSDRLPVHINEAGKLKGLRLKYKGSEVLSIVDKYIVLMKDLNSK